MAVALILLLVAVGSVLFHLLSPWWWTPIASNWRYIDDTISITFWITGFVFFAVVVFMAYCVFRFRHQEGRRAAYEPENKKLEWWLSVGTGDRRRGHAGARACSSGTSSSRCRTDATEVEVVGQQWQWSFRLPGKDGRLGTSDARNISSDNPLGLNPRRPARAGRRRDRGRRPASAGGKPVKVLLRSIDVLHDFYVPEFRAKMDMVPGMVTYFWFTPTRTGTFDVLCAELCGVGHPQMRGTVVVEEESDYHAWLEQQQTFAQLSPQAVAKATTIRSDSRLPLRR